MSSSYSSYTVTLIGGSPWGFRIQGSQESTQPLKISKINPGSKAWQAGVREGDELEAINDKTTAGLSPNESSDLIRSSLNCLRLTLRRDDRLGKPPKMFKSSKSIELNGSHTNDKTHETGGNKPGDGKSVPSSPLSITVSSKKVYCAVHRDRCKHRIHPIGWTPLPLAGGQDTSSSSPTTVALREQVAQQLTEQCIAQLKQACCDVWKVLSPSRAVSGLATRSHDSPPELSSTLPPPPGFSDSFDETWSFRTAPYSSAVAVVSTSQPQRRDSRRQVAPLCLEKAVTPGTEKESLSLSPRRPTSLIDGEATPCSPRSPFSPGQHSSPDSNSLGSWWDERRGSDPRRRDSCSSTHSNVSEEWKEKIRKYATTVQTSVCSPLQESVPLPGSEDAASPHPVPIMTKASSTGTHDEDLLKLVLDRNAPSLPQRSSSADTPSDRKREEAYGPPPLSLTAQSSSESTTITDVYPMRLERVFITTDEDTDYREAELLRANTHRLQVPSTKTESRQSSTETTSDPFSDRLLDFTSLNFKGDSRQSSTEVASETSTDIMPRSDSSETRSRSTDSIESHSNSSDGCHKTDSKSDSSTLVVRTSFEREDSVDRPAAIEALRALVAQNKDDDEDALTPPILDELTSLGRRRRSSPDDDMQIPSSYETLTLSEPNEDDTHGDLTIEEKTVVYFEKPEVTDSKDGDDTAQEAKRKQLVKADSWDLISENLSEELSQLIASFGEGICTKPLELGKSQSLDEYDAGSGGTNGSTPKGKGSFEEGEGSDETKSKKEESTDGSKDSEQKASQKSDDELKVCDTKDVTKKESELQITTNTCDEQNASPKKEGGLKVSAKKDDEQRYSPKKESGLKLSPKKGEDQRSSPKKESGAKLSPKSSEEARLSPKKETELKLSPKKGEEQRSSPKKETGLKLSPKKGEDQKSSPKKERQQTAIAKNCNDEMVTEVRQEINQSSAVTLEVNGDDVNVDHLCTEQNVTIVNITADSTDEEEKMHDILEETEEDLKRDALESSKGLSAAQHKKMAAKEKVVVKENVILKEKVIIKQLTKQESVVNEELESVKNDVVAMETVVKTDRTPPHIVVLSTSSSVQTDHSKPKKPRRETCDVGVQDERSPFSSPSYSDDFSNGTPGSHVSAHAATQTDESSLSKAMRFREQTASGGQGVTDVSLQTDESETLDDLASLKSDEVASLPSEGAITPIPDEEVEWYPGEAKTAPAAEVPSSSPRQSTTGLPTTEPTLTDITELPSAYLNSANLSEEGKAETREEEDEECTDTLILAEDEGDLPQSDIMLTIAYSVGEKDGSTDRTLQGIPKLPPPDPPPKPKAELLVQSSDEKDHLSPSYFDWGASECEFADASGDSAENSPGKVEDIPKDANKAGAVTEPRKKLLERKPTLAEEEKYDSDEKPAQGRISERRPLSRIAELQTNKDKSSVKRHLPKSDDPLELPSLPRPDSNPHVPGDDAKITSPTAQSEWPPLPSPDTLQPTDLVDDVFEYETESSSRDPASWPQLSNTFKYAYLGMVPGTVKQGPLLAGLPLGGQERLLDFGGTGRTKCRASSSPEKVVRTSMYGTTRSSRESSAKTEDGTTQWSPQEEDKGFEGYVLGLMSPRVEVEDKETQSDVEEHDGCPACKKVDLVDRAVQSEIAEQFPLSNLPTPEALECEDKQTQAELLRYIPKVSRAYRYQDKEVQSDLISPCFPVEYIRFMDLDNNRPRDLDDPYRLRRYTLPRTARTQMLQELGDRSNDGDLDVDVEGTHSLMELPPDKEPQTPTTPTAPLCRFPRSFATNPRTRALLVDDLVGRGALSDGEEWTRSATTPRYMGKMVSSAVPATQSAPSKAQVLKELRGGRLENRKAPKRGRTSSTTTPTTPTTDCSTPKDAAGSQTTSDHPLTRVARGSPTPKEPSLPPPQPTPSSPTVQAKLTAAQDLPIATQTTPLQYPQSLEVIPVTTAASPLTPSETSQTYKEEGVWSPGKAVSQPSSSRSCPSLSEAAALRTENVTQSSKDDGSTPIPPVWKPFGQGHSNAEQPHFRSIRLDNMTLKENQGQHQQTPASVTTPTPPPPPSSESMASWQTTQAHVYTRVHTLEQTISSSSSSSTTATTATTTVTTPTTQTSPPSGAPSQLSPPFTRLNGCSNLPRSQSPTITLLQKAREGQIPKGASYIDKPADSSFSSSFPRVNDSLFRVKSAEIHDNYRKVHLEPIKHQGIGPTTPQGLPIGLRTGIKEENKGEWYKKMYKSLHRIGDSSEDDFIMVKYRHRGRIPYSTTGYMSEPEPERDALRTYSKYATLDRRRPRFDEFADHRNRTMPPTKSKSASSSWTPPSAKYSSDVYRNQPKKIEDYEPGHSSIAEREAKLDEEVVKVSPDIQPMATLPPTNPSTHGSRHNAQLDRPAPSYVFKDGYESDSTLVYHKHGSERSDPMDQRLWYREIQRGGDIPLAGFRRPVPERAKDFDPSAFLTRAPFIYPCSEHSVYYAHIHDPSQTPDSARCRSLTELHETVLPCHCPYCHQDSYHELSVSPPVPIDSDYSASPPPPRRSSSRLPRTIPPQYMEPKSTAPRRPPLPISLLTAGHFLPQPYRSRSPSPFGPRTPVTSTLDPQSSMASRDRSRSPVSRPVEAKCQVSRTKTQTISSLPKKMDQSEKHATVPWSQKSREAKQKDKSFDSSFSDWSYSKPQHHQSYLSTETGYNSQSDMDLHYSGQQTQTMVDQVMKSIKSIRRAYESEKVFQDWDEKMTTLRNRPPTHLPVSYQFSPTERRRPATALGVRQSCESLFIDRPSTLPRRSREHRDWRRLYHSSDRLSRSLSPPNIPYRLYILSILRTLKKSARFAELQKCYTSLDQVAKLEKFVHDRERMLLKKRRGTSYILSSASVNELDRLHSELDRAQQNKAFFYKARTKEQVQWHRERDRGLRWRDKSVEDVRKEYSDATRSKKYKRTVEGHTKLYHSCMSVSELVDKYSSLETLDDEEFLQPISRAFTRSSSLRCSKRVTEPPYYNGWRHSSADTYRVKSSQSYLMQKPKSTEHARTTREVRVGQSTTVAPRTATTVRIISSDSKPKTLQDHDNVTQSKQFKKTKVGTSREEIRQQLHAQLLEHRSQVTADELLSSEETPDGGGPRSLSSQGTSEYLMLVSPPKASKSVTSHLARPVSMAAKDGEYQSKKSLNPQFTQKPYVPVCWWTNKVASCKESFEDIFNRIEEAQARLRSRSLPRNMSLGSRTDTPSSFDYSSEPLSPVSIQSSAGKPWSYLETPRRPQTTTPVPKPSRGHSLPPSSSVADISRQAVISKTIKHPHPTMFAQKQYPPPVTYFLPDYIPERTVSTIDLTSSKDMHNVRPFGNMHEKVGVLSHSSMTSEELLRPASVTIRVKDEAVSDAESRSRSRQRWSSASDVARTDSRTGSYYLRHVKGGDVKKLQQKYESLERLPSPTESTQSDFRTGTPLRRKTLSESNVFAASESRRKALVMRPVCRVEDGTVQKLRDKFEEEKLFEKPPPEGKGIVTAMYPSPSYVAHTLPKVKKGKRSTAFESSSTLERSSRVDLSQAFRVRGVSPGDVERLKMKCEERDRAAAEESEVRSRSPSPRRHREKDNLMYISVTTCKSNPDITIDLGDIEPPETWKQPVDSLSRYSSLPVLSPMKSALKQTTRAESREAKSVKTSHQQQRASSPTRSVQLHDETLDYLWRKYAGYDWDHHRRERPGSSLGYDYASESHSRTSSPIRGMSGGELDPDLQRTYTYSPLISSTPVPSMYLQSDDEDTETASPTRTSRSPTPTPRSRSVTPTPRSVTPKPRSRSRTPTPTSSRAHDVSQSGTPAEPRQPSSHRARAAYSTPMTPTAAPERRLARSWSTESAPAGPLDLSILPPVPAPPPKVPLVDANVSDSPHRYNETQVNIHYKAPIRELEKEYIEEEELRVKQEEMMKQFYEQERRKKYLQELNDIESRRHSDNFTPGQKSPIPLNRYDQFDGPASPQPRAKTPESKTVARARYKFVAQSARELSFNKGDVIYVTRRIDKNWYEGEHHGMIGLFPVNYVEIIPHDSVRMTPKKLTEGLAKAKYHFRAQTSLELPLVKGELIVLTRRVDHNWYMGRIGGREGIVPVSYVEVMREPGDGTLKPTSPTPKSMASPVSRSVIVNGSASSPHTQSFNPPSYYNQKLNTYQSPYATMRRYVPNRPPEPTYAEKKQPVNQSLHIDTHSEPVPYRALYDYQPQNEDELELREGDTVFVMEKCDDGWYVGSSLRTGFFGTFPGNYVERL